MQEKKEVEKEKGRGDGHRKMKGDQKRERESLSVGFVNSYGLHMLRTYHVFSAVHARDIKSWILH